MSRLAVITGAGRGLGRAVALELAATGFDVTALDRDEKALADTLERCRASGVDTTAIVVDLADDREREAALTSLPLADVVVANAGVLDVVAAADMTTSQLSRMLTINTVATFDVIRTTTNAMRRAGASGTVVVIASTSAHRVYPGLSGYAASKHALRALVTGFEQELAGTGIRITTAYPAGIATGIAGAPEKHWGGMTPEDVARVLVASVVTPAPSVRVAEIHLVHPEGE